MHEALRSACDEGRGRESRRGIASMTIEIPEQTLWLIPVSLAVGFMVWVLWNWWREEHPKKVSRVESRRVHDRPIGDQRSEMRRPRAINLPTAAPSSEARDWHRRGKPILH